MYLYKTFNTKKKRNKEKLIKIHHNVLPSFLIKYYAKISTQNCHVWQASLQQLNTITTRPAWAKSTTRWKQFTLVLTLLHRCLDYRAIYGETLELIVKLDFILFISVHWHHHFTKHRQMNTSIINATLVVLCHCDMLQHLEGHPEGVWQERVNSRINRMRYSTVCVCVRLRESQHSYMLQQSLKCKRRKIIILCLSDRASSW